MVLSCINLIIAMVLSCIDLIIAMVLSCSDLIIAMVLSCSDLIIAMVLSCSDLIVTKGDQYDVREEAAAGRGEVRNLGSEVLYNFPLFLLPSKDYFFNVVWSLSLEFNCTYCRITGGSL